MKKKEKKPATPVRKRNKPIPASQPPKVEEQAAEPTAALPAEGL